MKNIIKNLLKESIEIKNNLIENQLDSIEKITISIIDTLKKGKKLFIFGNGGSAADSQHMAAELIGRFKRDRKPLPAIALTTNISTITSIANDYDYSLVFSRQIDALGEKGDIALGISTSGNSQNVIKAIKKAKEKSLTTIALTGKEGGELAKICQLTLNIPSQDTPRIQEAHITCIHIICELTEKALFNKKDDKE